MKFLLLIALFVTTFSDSFSQRRFLLPAPKKMIEQSRVILFQQVGITEATNNNDGEVEKYWRLMGFTTPQPYCASGQYYCIYQACVQLGLSIKLISLKKTALAYGQFQDASVRGVKVPFLPQVDDLLYWKHVQKITGHVERITAVKQAGWVETIGMNTSSGNGGDQRDGGGVYRRKRNVSFPLGRMQVSGTIGWKYTDTVTSTQSSHSEVQKQLGSGSKYQSSILF